MPGFNSAGNGDLTSGLFLTETDILDDLVGDSLFVMGKDFNGDLGLGSAGLLRSTPTVVGNNNWKQISCGYKFTSAIKTDGTLWLWGRNSYGQLGDGTGGAGTDKASPVQTVSGDNNWKQVSSGSDVTAAIKTDGTLWLWGRNSYGQLGDGTSGATTEKSSPVQTVAGGNNWKQVSCRAHCAAIKTDGTLWVWGFNGDGRLGDNTITDKSSPVQTIAGGNNWKQISAGGFTTAIKTDGTLWAWGRNEFGHLGDGTTTFRSSPVQTVAGGTNWRKVIASSRTGYAIKTDGTLWAWGHNAYGNIGDGTTVNKSSPVQTIAGGNNWKDISSGSARHVGAIKTDGTMWMWGRQAYGQLGNNLASLAAGSSPAQTVSGGNNWKQVSVGHEISAAITTGQVT